MIDAMLQDLSQAPVYPPMFELPNIPVKGERAFKCSLDVAGADEPVKRPHDSVNIFSGAKGSVPAER